MQGYRTRPMAQQRVQLVLYNAGGDRPCGFVAPRVIQKEFTEPLLVKIRHACSARVELVNDPPAVGRAVRQSKVGVANAVLAKVLPCAS